MKVSNLAAIVDFCRLRSSSIEKTHQGRKRISFRLWSEVRFKTICSRILSDRLSAAFRFMVDRVAGSAIFPLLQEKWSLSLDSFRLVGYGGMDLRNCVYRLVSRPVYPRLAASCQGFALSDLRQVQGFRPIGFPTGSSSRHGGETRLPLFQKFPDLRAVDLNRDFAASRAGRASENRSIATRFRRRVA